jgi:hypothetical protein
MPRLEPVGVKGQIPHILPLYPDRPAWWAAITKRFRFGFDLLHGHIRQQLV